MSISVIEQADRLWSEFRREVELDIHLLPYMGDGCDDDDIELLDTLRAIIEDAYVSGVFLRDKDIIVCAEDISQVCSKLKSSISFHFSTILPLDNLDKYVSPCACVSHIADGLVRIILDMANDKDSYPFGFGALAPKLLEAFESFFRLGFPCRYLFKGASRHLL